MPKLDTLDYVVLVLYMLGAIGLGLWMSRRVRVGQDFFLAGRSLPWWAVGVALVVQILIYSFV